MSQCDFAEYFQATHEVEQIAATAISSLSLLLKILSRLDFTTLLHLFIDNFLLLLLKPFYVNSCDGP